MLNPEDRRAIETLFDRLAEVERRTPERDRDAEALIHREIERQPGAPYYMAQTIIVEQRALELAEQRIQELEGQLADRGRQGERHRNGDREVQRQRGPWDRPDDRYDPGIRGGMGGGFLAGAAQTALGVAGGVLLGSAIGSLLGAGGAHAAEADHGDRNDDQQQDDNASEDQQQDDNSGNDDGGFGGDDGDFGGDDGGFDMGGDF